MSDFPKQKNKKNSNHAIGASHPVSETNPVLEYHKLFYFYAYMDFIFPYVIRFIYKYYCTTIHYYYVHTTWTLEQIYNLPSRVCRSNKTTISAFARVVRLVVI